MVCATISLRRAVIAAEPGQPAADKPVTQIAPIEFTKETLSNGLTVIYAPLKTAPVVHMRVLYHVGSRDEKPDRQGFAHMFEHMMFRGSKHVPNEVHMKLINGTGGDCNAFTSFDQTCYVNTIPSNHLEMALYLESDRMASFVVDDEMFKTERKVVSEEWRLRYANQPYGPLFADFTKTAYTTHPYRWTPIGDMDHLRASTSADLQEFWNTYYVPNNACLIISGDFDLEQTRKWVQQFFGWIPRGPDVPRNFLQEPPQAEPRKLVVHKRAVPVARVMVGYKTAPYRSDDNYALDVLGQILGEGSSSRLNRKLVNNDDPSCLGLQCGLQPFEDPGLFIAAAAVLPGKDVDAVEKELIAAINDVAANGVTQEEIDKVLENVKQTLITGRLTATSIGEALGESEVFGGDAARVNSEWDKYCKLTPADIQAVARKYLAPSGVTVLQYLPDPTGKNSNSNESAEAAEKAAQTGKSEVVKSERPVAPRAVTFPADYPTTPPVATEITRARFEKGTEMTVNGVKVIVVPDHRLPLASWSLVMRAGGDASPHGKEGVAGLTAQMLSRGAAGKTFEQLSEDLESRGIDIVASDGGDTTRIGGSCNSDQLDYAIDMTRQMLRQPDFPKDEFDKLKQQSVVGLMQSLSNPGTVASRELTKAIYGDAPQGKMPTAQSLMSISLDDVKNWYKAVYHPNDALLVFSGDVTPERGRELAGKLLEGFNISQQSLPKADYTQPPVAQKRRVILVDNPDGKQATIRMGIPAYDIRSDDKFAGTIMSRILSDGIESKLNKYVRAEKGYTYGCSGIFRPTRHGGLFEAEADTNPDTTADCIEAMLKVLADCRQSEVSEVELKDGQTRVVGSMVMEMQTIAQQAIRRLDCVLNGYPIDYYDVYPQKVAAVTSGKIKDIMNKYVLDNAWTIVVVAPADKVKAQLERLGEVEVVPMPAKRMAGQAKPPTTQKSEG